MAAEREKTLNYGLDIFGPTQSTMTFKEFRTYIAGVGADASSYSNMQQIDALLKECDTKIDNNFESAKNYTEDRINDLKDDIAGLIQDDDGTLFFGGENGMPMEFFDGSRTSTLKDGVLTVGSVKTDSVYIDDYFWKYNSANGHLELHYKKGSGA